MSKYCINCKFYVEAGEDYSGSPIFNVCSKSLKKAKPDLVTGLKPAKYSLFDRCELHRREISSNFCGIEAVWFEGK